MFGNLYQKECKAVGKSIIYFAFVGVVIMFYISQLGNYAGRDIKEYKQFAQKGSVESLMGNSVEEGDSPWIKNPLIEPPQGALHYGTKPGGKSEQSMKNALLALEEEWKSNLYVTYPIGFYKTVKLDRAQQDRIEEILVFLQDVEAKDYDVFEQYMSKVDDILGGGSAYRKENLSSYSSIEKTYEEKLAEYHDLIKKDRITNAYARLFSDYMGLVIALFGIFVPVSFALRDGRSHINELIYYRPIKSFTFIGARYLAVVSMMLLPFILLSFLPTIQLVIFGRQQQIQTDIFAFIKYIFAWLFPTVLMVTAVGFCFTILTDTPIGILIQFVFSFMSVLLSGIKNIQGGGYGFELAIRHNTVGNRFRMEADMASLVMNRGSYIFVALLLLGGTILIYEQKRKGKIDVGGSVQKIFRHNKGADTKNTLG